MRKNFIHFQGRRKTQVSTSLHTVVPVRVVWITALGCRRVEVSKPKFDRTVFVFFVIFVSVDFLDIVFSFRLVSKSLMINLVIIS